MNLLPLETIARKLWQQRRARQNKYSKQASKERKEELDLQCFLLS
jgi:hypothetical protein